MTYNRWSTVHIAPLSRAQFWSDASREAQMPHTPLVAQPERFEAVLTSRGVGAVVLNRIQMAAEHGMERLHADGQRADRKSTRLNSSHLVISYAVFCLKKKILQDTMAE